MDPLYQVQITIETQGMSDLQLETFLLGIVAKYKHHPNLIVTGDYIDNPLPPNEVPT